MVGCKDGDQGKALVVRHAGAGQVGDEVLQALLVNDMLEALLLGADAVQPDHSHQRQPGHKRKLGYVQEQKPFSKYDRNRRCQDR